MVFGKKKETKEEKAARLRKELEEVERVEEPAPMEDKTPVAELKNTSKEVKAEKNEMVAFIEEIESRFGVVFPELGPSDAAHVERMLLLSIAYELRRMREER